VLAGIGREDLFFGYSEDDKATPQIEQEYMLGFLDLAEVHGLEVLVTDYCSTPAKVESSYAWCEDKHYISFAADQRDLSSIPGYPVDPYNTNDNDVTMLSQARNFLYLINTEQYATKTEFIEVLQQTDYDVLIIDLFFDGDDILDAQDIASLSIKASGGLRLILAYCSIGEAEDYRYYWQDAWEFEPPAWLGPENPDWPGNYKVRYWDPDWQDIIFNNDNSYIKKILDAGFDGIYLDIIDAFEYWEHIQVCLT
jgi:cysteinyl-tRNA synthetase